MSFGGGGSSKKEAKPREPSAEEKSLWKEQTNLARSVGKIGREQWNSWKQHGLPQLLGLKNKVNKWASSGRIKQQEGLASADVKQAYGKARGGFMQNLSRFGLNPGSGKFAGSLRSLALGEAASTAGAKTGARTGILNRDMDNQMNLANVFAGQQNLGPQNLSRSQSGLANVSGQKMQDRLSGDRLRMQGYQAEQQAEGGMWSGLGSLAGSLGGAMILASDERLKLNMTPIDELPRGIIVYAFQYIDDPHTTYTGVSAQELIKIKPELVSEMNGFLMVNYFDLIDQAVAEAQLENAA